MIFANRVSRLCMRLGATARVGVTQEFYVYDGWCEFGRPGFERDIPGVVEMCERLGYYVSLRLEEEANGDKWSVLAVCLSPDSPAFNLAPPDWAQVYGSDPVGEQNEVEQPRPRPAVMLHFNGE